MKFRLATPIAVAACSILVSGSKSKFPAKYSGGLYRTIFVRLELKDKKTYIYSEFTHAGYSVKDSGTYRVKDTVITFNSIRTLHQMRQRGKRMANGKYFVPPDSINHQKLFVQQKCLIRADTISIDERNVLINEEFGFNLVNYHK